MAGKLLGHSEMLGNPFGVIQGMGFGVAGGVRGVGLGIARRDGQQIVRGGQQVMGSVVGGAAGLGALPHGVTPIDTHTPKILVWDISAAGIPSSDNEGSKFSDSGSDAYAYFVLAQSGVHAKTRTMRNALSDEAELLPLPPVTASSVRKSKPETPIEKTSRQNHERR